MRAQQNIRDKYMNFFSNVEACTNVITLQEFSYDTGISARGGWIWEIHTIEVMMQPDPAVVASGVVGYQSISISMLGGETVQPNISDFGCLYRRQLYRIGNGTTAVQYWPEPTERIMPFVKPFLYAKPKLYVYYQQSSATGALAVRTRIGFTTRRVSGNLMVEVMEQHLSSAT